MDLLVLCQHGPSPGKKKLQLRKSLSNWPVGKTPEHIWGYDW